MGCSSSKLDDEEAVQLCKDRKRFIKQAVEQRARFATGHLAYIQSLRKVSSALREYIEGDEPHDFLLDSFITPPLTPPMKKAGGGFISISPRSFPPARIKSESGSTLKVNYLRSGGNPAVSVEERPQSPETVRVQSYSPMQYEFGFDGFFAMQSPPMNSSSFFSYSPGRPSTNIPPHSPQTSQWDFFWNPFSSLDNYGYPNRDSLDHQTFVDDDIRGLRQLREEEGIPDLEDDVEQEESDNIVNVTYERAKVDANCHREEVIVEDVEEDDEDDVDEEEEEEAEDEESGTETNHETTGLQQNRVKTSVEISRSQTARQVETSNKEMAVGDQEAKDEMPGFTVYVNRRPTSMAEVIKELEDNFMFVCSAANEVSAMLEASKAQYTSPSSELTGFVYFSNLFSAATT